MLYKCGVFFLQRVIGSWGGWAPYFSPRDGKIGVHKIHSTFAVKFSAHEQEVNCVDCKGSIIVSGSRDRTAKVRWSPPYILLFPLSVGGRGEVGLASQDWLRTLGGGSGEMTQHRAHLCACGMQLALPGCVPASWAGKGVDSSREACHSLEMWRELKNRGPGMFPQICGLSSDPNILF